MKIPQELSITIGSLLISAIAVAQTMSSRPAPQRAAELDLTPLFKAVDKNKDGCLDNAEWREAGLPESSYLGLKDDKGCVTLERMAAEPAPPGIDLNGDGKLTVEEFREFDKKQVQKLQR